MSETRLLWVVEIWTDDRWESTVGVSISRSAGRNALREWRHDNPSDEFRLVPYVPRKERR